MLRGVRAEVLSGNLLPRRQWCFPILGLDVASCSCLGTPITSSELVRCTSVVEDSTFRHYIYREYVPSLFDRLHYQHLLDLVRDRILIAIAANHDSENHLVSPSKILNIVFGFFRLYHPLLVSEAYCQ